MSTRTNPLARLLEMLPAKVADDKRAAILADLQPLGYESHWRQTCLREHKNPADIYAQVAWIICKHLEIPMEFLWDADIAAKETARLVNHYAEAQLADL